MFASTFKSVPSAKLLQRFVHYSGPIVDRFFLLFIVSYTNLLAPVSTLNTWQQVAKL